MQRKLYNSFLFRTFAKKNKIMDFLSLAQNRYTTKIYNGKTLSKETLEHSTVPLKYVSSSFKSLK